MTETGPFASDTVTNIYWNRLRVHMNLQQPTGVWTNAFAYDLAGRLAEVISPAGAFTNEYLAGLPSKLVAQINQPIGSYITNAYDGNARLLSTALMKSDGATVLDAENYSYNAGNQRTVQTFNEGTTVSYTYDPIGQLKVANSSVTHQSRGYVYDAAWNLNVLTNGGAVDTYSVNNLNELTTVQSTNYFYDANGNLIYIGGVLLAPVGGLMASVGSQYCFCYDDENRLTTWRYAANGGSPACGSNPGTNSDMESQFIYDGLGRLRERIDYTAGCGGGDWCWQESAAVEYIYDGMRVIQERNSANTPTVSFTRGNDLSGTMEGAGGIGGLLARWQGPGLVWYYHADGNGNVMCLENTSQGIAESSRYDAYGNLVSGSFHEFGFSSKEYFSAGGLYYYGYRWYAPSLQRWLNRDPLADESSLVKISPNTQSTHLSMADVINIMDSQPFEGRSGSDINTFVHNSPVNLEDVWGLDCYDDFQSCMSPGHVCTAASGGIAGAGATLLGSYAGAGPHHGPKGYPRPVIRGGKPTTYGKGLGRSLGGGLAGGAAFGVLALEAACYGALLGCLDGQQAPPPPTQPPWGTLTFTTL